MATNTVRRHRVLRAPPEQVYRAFLDAEAMGKESLAQLAKLVEPEIAD